jgi:hypothetical protein
MDMPRSSSRTPCKDNAVIARLKSGKGNVAGLKMLVAVDGLALFPVTVTGLDFYARQDHGRSVSVRVEPVGGHGHIWVAPGELLDDTPTAIALHDRKCEANDRYRMVASSNSDRQRRTELLNIRGEMTAKQKEEFAVLLADRLGDKATADPVAAINRMCGDYEFRRVAELAVRLRYGLDEESGDY